MRLAMLNITRFHILTEVQMVWNVWDVVYLLLQPLFFMCIRLQLLACLCS